MITARLTESDKALAAESRILREKEFIQLKKDRVIIHTGHLAGRLLADVLMADLMETRIASSLRHWLLQRDKMRMAGRP